MGVYIKGMEMPQNCMECPVVVCLKTKDECPLVPVPQHGRLIDADALNRLIDESYPMTDRVDVHNGYAICQEMIKQLPTIIPADPAEDDTDFFTAGHLHLGYAEERET